MRQNYDDFAAHAGDWLELEAVCVGRDELEVIWDFGIEDCKEAHQSEAGKEEDGEQSV